MGSVFGEAASMGLLMITNDSPGCSGVVQHSRPASRSLLKASGYHPICNFHILDAGYDPSV